MNTDEIKEDAAEVRTRKKTGPKSAVTRESVYNACEILKKNGQTPSYDFVVELLGTGSTSKVNPILRDWKAANGYPTSSTPIPNSVGKAIQDHIAEVVEKSEKILRDELDQANKMCIRLEKELEILEALRDEAMDECDALKSELDKTSGKCQQQEEESLKKDQRIKDLLREITDAKSLSSRAEADRDRTERALQSLESQQAATIKMLSDDLIEVRKDRDSREGKLRQIEADLAKEKSNLEEMQKKLKVSEISHATVEKEREMVYSRIMESDAKLSESLSDRGKLQKDLAQQVNENADLRRQVSESTEKHRISEVRLKAFCKRFAVPDAGDDSLPF